METNVNKIKIKMDGKEVLVDESITILEAARRNDIRIPTLCHHPALSNWGGCRMCLVEVDGSPKLVASCVTPVRNGMEVVTSNDHILECRRTILEFIFAERNHNCMFCPQSGDCELQQLAYELQMDHLTVAFSFNQFPVDVTSAYMAIDHNRCILCGRCVRACKEIAGACVLNFQNRGPESLIGMDLNETRDQSSCYGCGICVQVCPTGAMVNRYRSHYAVKGHAKDWRQIESVCSQCGLLCPTVLFERDNNLLKIEGRLSDTDGGPVRGQLCYKGRFEAIKNTHKRLESPMIRTENQTWEPASWDKAFERVCSTFNAVKAKEGGRAIFGLASSAASNEELLFFKDLMAEGCAAYVDTFDGGHFRTVAEAWKDIKQSYKEAPWHMLPAADVVILLGASPYQSQPLLSSLLRKSVMENGQKVAVFGQCDPIPPYTPYYFPVEDQDLPLVIQALKSQAMKLNDTPELLAKAGFEADDVKAFHEAAEILSNAANPLFIIGERLTGLRDASVLAEVMRLAELKGLCPDKALRLIILKPRGNSAGAWKLGVASGGKTPSSNHWKAGLVLLNELDDSPLAASAQGLGADFIAMISPYFPQDLADNVQVLIPKPFGMEEEGTYTSLEGVETAHKQKVLQPPESMKAPWQIFTTLAKGVGYTPRYRSWEELSQQAETEIKLPK